MQASYRLLLALSLVAVPQIASAQAPITPNIGMNLGFHAPWLPSTIFTDVFKQARPWLAHPIDDPDVFDAPVTIPSDPQGWPLEVPFTVDGQTYGVHTVLLDMITARHPAGDYTLSFEGDGEIIIAGDSGFHHFTNGGPHTFDVVPAAGIYMELVRSSSVSPVRNIQVLLPDQAPSTTFNPPFVAGLQPFSFVRVMATSRLNEGEYPCDNGVPVTDASCTMLWATRAQMDDAVQTTGRGVALEYLVDLVNATGADLWANVIHGADRPYMDAYAQLVFSRLAPDRLVYVELSNEIWNTDPEYPQRDYFVNLGATPEFGGSGNQGARMAYANRAGALFDAFVDAFGTANRHRLVLVAPGATPDLVHSTELMQFFHDPTYNPDGHLPDALAIAPYFGTYAPNEILATRTSTEIATVVTTDDLLDIAELSITTERPDPIAQGETAESLVSVVRPHAALAAQYGVELVAYEGGQHLTQTAGYDANLQTLIFEANRSPRMRALYELALEVWYREGGGRLGAFSYVTAYDQAGAFGALEYPTQTASTAPKYQALLDAISGTLVIDPACTAASPWHCRDVNECDTISGTWCDRFCTTDASCPASMCTPFAMHLCDANSCASIGENWCGDYCTSNSVCCTASTPWGCATESQCTDTGATWCGSFCNDEPTCPVCAPSSPWDCGTETTCTDAGGSWCDDSWCHGEPACPACVVETPWHCASQTECSDIGMAWCGTYCDDVCM